MLQCKRGGDSDLARSGKLPESELDAIALTNLQQKKFELEIEKKTVEKK